MSYFDVAIIVLLSGFAFFGVFTGLLHAIGSLVGTIFGAYVANTYFEQVAAWAVTRVEWNMNTAKVVMFLLLFTTISRLVGVSVWLAEKLLHILPIPFGRSMNRLLGGLFGFLEGTVVLGIFVYLTARFPLSGRLAGSIETSKVIEMMSPLIERTVDHAPYLISKFIRFL